MDYLKIWRMRLHQQSLRLDCHLYTREKKAADYINECRDDLTCISTKVLANLLVVLAGVLGALFKGQKISRLIARICALAYRISAKGLKAS